MQQLSMGSVEICQGTMSCRFSASKIFEWPVKKGRSSGKTKCDKHVLQRCPTVILAGWKQWRMEKNMWGYDSGCSRDASELDCFCLTQISSPRRTLQIVCKELVPVWPTSPFPLPVAYGASKKGQLHLHRFRLAASPPAQPRRTTQPSPWTPQVCCWSAGTVGTFPFWLPVASLSCGASSLSLRSLRKKMLNLINV